MAQFGAKIPERKNGRGRREAKLPVMAVGARGGKLSLIVETLLDGDIASLRVCRSIGVRLYARAGVMDMRGAAAPPRPLTRPAPPPTPPSLPPPSPGPPKHTPPSHAHTAAHRDRLTPRPPPHTRRLTSADRRLRGRRCGLTIAQFRDICTKSWLEMRAGGAGGASLPGSRCEARRCGLGSSGI